jgi:hypothetical protein
MLKHIEHKVNNLSSTQHAYAEVEAQSKSSGQFNGLEHQWRNIRRKLDLSRAFDMLTTLPRLLHLGLKTCRQIDDKALLEYHVYHKKGRNYGSDTTTLSLKDDN